MASPRSKLDEIVESFSTLEDPRSHINRRHPLPSILVIAVLAVLAGAAGPTAIARWAKFRRTSSRGSSTARWAKFRRTSSRGSSTCRTASPARRSSAAS
ncbi:MAG TPA: transposase family protein [Isosphaeraceae bacterium]|jgi:hypothetical protein